MTDKDKLHFLESSLEKAKKDLKKVKSSLYRVLNGRNIELEEYLKGVVEIYKYKIQYLTEKIAKDER